MPATPHGIGNGRDEVATLLGEARVRALDIAPDQRTGTWALQRRRVECSVYHHPPDTTRPAALHKRARQVWGRPCPCTQRREETVWNIRSDVPLTFKATFLPRAQGEMAAEDALRVETFPVVGDRIYKFFLMVIVR